MALTGTLADLGIADLVQVPHVGRKTGELIVAGENDAARLYYEQGKLVHATMGALRGIDVLVEVLGWLEGEFEFRVDVPAGASTISMDLHRAVMLALKTRDERRAEEERRRKAEKTGNGDARLAKLTDFVEKAGFIRHAFVVGRDGTVIARASVPDEESAALEPLSSSLRALASSYPRAGLRRVLVDDADGTVVLSAVAGGEAVVVVASGDAPLGAVSMAASKLATNLNGGSGK